MKKRKMDTTEAKVFKKYTLYENSVRINIEKLRQRDAGKVPLRLNANTIILVKPQNCNAKYASQRIKKLGLIS